jgi:hypothetical protein
MNFRFLRSFLFSLVVLGFLYYAYRYIQASSFFIEGKPFYALFDDAMISMRYAWNLAHGNGLVWNPGERVEGFTNPLWVGFMALFHFFPIPPEKISFYIQAAGALFLAGNLYFVKKISEEFTDSMLVMLAAVLITASYGPLNTWGLLGMEVSLLVLVTSAAVWMTLRTDPGRFNPWTYVLLAVSTLVRVDMAVPYLVILGVMLFVQPKFRKQHLLWGLGLLTLFIGGQTLARYLYYGDLLPNTYYLKLEGFPFTLRILRGLYTLFMLVWYSNWVLCLLPLAIFIFRRDWKVTLFWLIFLAQAAYSVFVGGDAWEHRGGANRFISIAIPLFFVLFALVLDEIRKAVAGRWRRPESVSAVDGNRKDALWISNAVMILFILFSIGNFNALLSDWNNVERWLLRRRATFIAGNEQNIYYALDLEKITKPGASLAVIGAGTTPYLLPDRYAIDLLGKADPVIAHGPIRFPMSIVDIPDMRPGHMKWNYAHSIGELKPDVIVLLWEGTGDEFKPFEADYVPGGAGNGSVFLLRKDSPNILWDQVVSGY